MSRVPRRFAIHLLLRGGHHEVVHFPNLQEFQKWYGGVLTSAEPGSFVNVPIGELEEEYLVVRADSVIGLRVEPLYGALD